MSAINDIMEAREARANAYATVRYFDKLIKKLEPKPPKKPKRDFSAIDARIQAKGIKKLLKTQCT